MDLKEHRTLEKEFRSQEMETAARKCLILSFADASMTLITQFCAYCHTQGYYLITYQQQEEAHTKTVELPPEIYASPHVLFINRSSSC
jgi:hypothetical protein